MVTRNRLELKHNCDWDNNTTRGEIIARTKAKSFVDNYNF